MLASANHAKYALIILHRHHVLLTCIIWAKSNIVKIFRSRTISSFILISWCTCFWALLLSLLLFSAAFHWPLVERAVHCVTWPQHLCQPIGEYAISIEVKMRKKEESIYCRILFVTINMGQSRGLPWNLFWLNVTWKHNTKKRPLFQLILCFYCAV